MGFALHRRMFEPASAMWARAVAAAATVLVSLPSFIAPVTASIHGVQSVRNIHAHQIKKKR